MIVLTKEERQAKFRAWLASKERAEQIEGCKTQAKEAFKRDKARDRRQAKKQSSALYDNLFAKLNTTKEA